MVRWGKLAVVAMLTLSVGLHWVFLQSAAWMYMVVKYSANAPLKEALAMTFDGQHPCIFCKFIAEGRKAEQEQGCHKFHSIVKFDLFLESSPTAVVQSLESFKEIPWIRLPEARMESPPKPPPRLSSSSLVV